MKINFCLLLVISFCLVACGVNSKKTESVPVMIDFKKIMTVYFGQYQPDFKPSIIRPNNSLATLHIAKENLSKIKMNEIRNKLKSDGWKEVENYGNYSEYCINKYQKIAILFPENELEKAKDGRKYTIQIKIRGQFFYIIMTLVLITVKRKSERRLNEMNLK